MLISAYNGMRRYISERNLQKRFKLNSLEGEVSEGPRRVSWGKRTLAAGAIALAAFCCTPQDNDQPRIGSSTSDDSGSSDDDSDYNQGDDSNGSTGNDDFGDDTNLDDTMYDDDSQNGNDDVDDTGDDDSYYTTSSTTTTFVPTTTSTTSTTISPGTCPEGMIYVPGGLVNVVYHGERWGGEYVESVQINPFCVDQYEASQPDATFTYRGAWNEGFQIEPPIPQSKSGVLPWSEISHDSSMVACQNAEKRLPTLMEWQMAFSGTSGLNWPWGNESQENSCYAEMGFGNYPTGGCGYNIFGTGEIYDMVGNVSEWINGYWDSECYGDSEVLIAGGPTHYFFDTESQQTRNPEVPSCWVWASYGLNRSGLHHHNRYAGGGHEGYNDDGFRCVKDIE